MLLISLHVCCCDVAVHVLLLPLVLCCCCACHATVPCYAALQMKHFLTSLNAQVLHLAAAHDRYLSAVDPFVTLKVCDTAQHSMGSAAGVSNHTNPSAPLIRDFTVLCTSACTYLCHLK